jgi:hypothetical protein
VESTAEDINSSEDFRERRSQETPEAAFAFYSPIEILRRGPAFVKWGDKCDVSANGDFALTIGIVSELSTIRLRVQSRQPPPGPAGAKNETFGIDPA